MGLKHCKLDTVSPQYVMLLSTVETPDHEVAIVLVLFEKLINVWLGGTR